MQSGWAEEGAYMSEDCLTLNIWRPAEPAQNRAVMVGTISQCFFIIVILFRSRKPTLN